MLVHHFLENSAHTFPDKPAVWEKNNWFSFSGIDERANRIANYLIDNGVRRGDRVAILFENSVDYIAAYYGILKAGAVTVALNTDTNPQTLIYLLNDAGAKAVIANGRYTRHLLPALRKTPYLSTAVIYATRIEAYEEIGHCHTVTLESVYQNSPADRPQVRCIDIDLASIVYTSGSTGKPKGVTLTHLNIVSNTRSIVQYLKLSSEDRVMVVLPFYYIYGKSLLNTHFFVGGSVVLDNRFAFPNVILETMKQTEVTGFSGVPSTFMILLNKSTLRNHRFPALRYVTQAGGAMAPVVQKEVAKVFAPAKLFIMYGATEASARLSYLEPDLLTQKLGSIGKAIPNVDLYVADKEGNRLPAGEVGEIVARGSNIMQGYWNDPEETAKVLRKGLYFTGDLGREDEDGFIFVVGRSKDIIKAGGERISAKEIEEKLLEINEVHETAVIGVDDPVLGEAIKAFIVTRDGAEVDEEYIRTSLRKKLPPFKQPKYIEFRRDLPKNNSGKIMKAVLKEEEQKKTEQKS
ncbi:MAG TPA: AMP-dependent synthetase [Caldithrix abyssi]|uniref:AMP-dependent synthetase n=1 Tax=Caldithrix abyssi TaxID=187145 RepID=A0A7V4U1F2_CALAY|nr:AMP-dependent synthetase [Caldithrix abyssi]